MEQLDQNYGAAKETFDLMDENIRTEVFQYIQPQIPSLQALWVERGRTGLALESFQPSSRGEFRGTGTRGLGFGV